MWEGTTLRVMAADRPYGDYYDFYFASPEYFGYFLLMWPYCLTDVQPVVCYYTDWAIAALRVEETVSNIKYLWKGIAFLDRNSKTVTKWLIYNPLFEGRSFNARLVQGKGGGVFVCGLTGR
jgi:hypothetical protein